MLHYATVLIPMLFLVPHGAARTWSTQDMANVMLYMIKLSQPGCYHNVLLLGMYHGSGDNNLSSITWPAGSHCAWSVSVFRLVWCFPDPKQQSTTLITHPSGVPREAPIKDKILKLSYRFHFGLMFYKILHWINSPKHVYL